MRILSADVSAHIGNTVHIEGWLHKKRLLGGLTFINVRDRRGLTQVVIKDKDEVEKLRGMQIGTVLTVDGTVVEEPRAPGGAELHDATLEVLVPVTEELPIEIDKPLSHKPENLDTLFEHRVIGLRNLQEQKIFKIRAAIPPNWWQALPRAEQRSSNLITSARPLLLRKAHNCISR
jgi:nondiscriminating aspartyl-tRNA synthetase